MQSRSTATGGVPSAIVNAGSHRRVVSKRSRVMAIAGRVLLYAVLISLGLVFTIPFLWMLSTSLKAPGHIYVDPPQWIPNPIYFANYAETWQKLPFGAFVRNTVIITACATVGFVLASTMAAYAFSRLRFKGRNVYFAMLLSTMMLPGQVTLIPQFILFKNLGWLNTFLPLIVPAFAGSAFYIFLLRQFMMTLPLALDEAARIDGASPPRVLWSVLLPLAKPAIATVTVFSFMHNWNDFFGPLIYLTDQRKMTLAVGLQRFRGQYDTDYAHMMAGSLVAILPVLVVFFLAQDLFVQSIALTGMKG
ncbi:MAG: carbohydrate ABC transporter permease [Anaerolineae bacterium]